MGIYSCEEAKKLLLNKFVVVIGDSVQRGIYKDLVLLLQEDKYLHPNDLKRKGEISCNNDKMVYRSELKNGKGYREVRQYQTDYHLVRFYFTTRCYNEYVEEVILRDLAQNPTPDFVIMNSCLWDVSRYGPSSLRVYKENLQKLFRGFARVLPPETLLIWNTAMPISSQIQGQFLTPEIQFMRHTLRLDVVEGNFFASQVVVDYKYDVLDLHYYFRNHLEHRVKDGVHWDFMAHRRISNMLLTHAAEAWGMPRPRMTIRSGIYAISKGDDEKCVHNNDIVANRPNNSNQHHRSYSSCDTRFHSNHRRGYSSCDTRFHSNQHLINYSSCDTRFHYNHNNYANNFNGHDMVFGAMYQNLFNSYNFNGQVMSAERYQNFYPGDRHINVLKNNRQFCNQYFPY